MSIKKIASAIYISGLGLLPFVLILLPADFFDKGQSICISVLLLDTECYGCGMTRAIQHLIHLDFSAAAEFNKLSFIVFPMLSFLWVVELKTKLLPVAKSLFHIKQSSN